MPGIAAQSRKSWSIFTTTWNSRVPTALAVVGKPVVRGKVALRAYWSKALGGIGSLRFTVDPCLVGRGAHELAIIYTSDIDGRIRRVSENLVFDPQARWLRQRSSTE